MTPNPALKALSVPCVLFGGAVTAFLLSFRNVDVTVREKRLDALEAHYRYTHIKTGEQRTVEPLEHTLALEAKRESPWTVEDLWTPTHNNFVNIDPALMDLDFAPLDEATPDDVRALAFYWHHAPPEVAERWALWRTLISVDVSNALVDAYQVARRGRFPAPPPALTEGDSADPLAEADASRRSSRATSASSPTVT